PSTNLFIPGWLVPLRLPRPFAVVSLGQPASIAEPRHLMVSTGAPEGMPKEVARQANTDAPALTEQAEPRSRLGSFLSWLLTFVMVKLGWAFFCMDLPTSLFFLRRLFFG